MKITKMHGIGNDYVYVNGFEENVTEPAALARRVSDRHFGVGGDGLILIQPPSSPGSDCRMEMYNADGSRGLMCGNGIRCVAKYADDHGLRASGGEADVVVVDTDSGTLRVEIVERGSRDSLLRVGMGVPDFRLESLPARDDVGATRAIGAPLEVEGIGTVTVTLLSMGNPHCVVRLGDDQPAALRHALADLELERIGPLFEHHSMFPDRVNTEFVVTRGDASDELDFRVWERGSGETLACGTGACAAVVAGAEAGWLRRQVTVHLTGGDLHIDWSAATSEVFMTGPATEVFTAELSPAWLE